MQKRVAPENNSYPDLKHIGKKRYPFRLATTSFIYRAGYVENVQLLGPHFDEIELLFFESRMPQSCPSDALVDKLATIAAIHSVTFNVHLPIDISPGDLEIGQRQHALRVVTRYIRQTLPLAPTSFTLHLPYTIKATEAGMIRQWQDALIQVLSGVLDSNIDPDLICVENLDYPFEWVADIIDHFHLKICFDIGHMIVRKEALWPFYNRYQDRIGLIHAHGVRAGRDHQALDYLDHSDQESILNILQLYRGTVSLEVFSLSDLQRSLAFLAESGLAENKE